MVKYYEGDEYDEYDEPVRYRDEYDERVRYRDEYDEPLRRRRNERDNPNTRRYKVRREIRRYAGIRVPEVPDKEKAPGWGTTIWNVAKGAVPAVIAGAAIGVAHEALNKLDEQEEAKEKAAWFSRESKLRLAANVVSTYSGWIGGIMSRIPGLQLPGYALLGYNMYKRAKQTPGVSTTISEGIDKIRGKTHSYTYSMNRAFEEDPASRAAPLSF